MVHPSAQQRVMQTYLTLPSTSTLSRPNRIRGHSTITFTTPGVAALILIQCLLLGEKNHTHSLHCRHLEYTEGIGKA
eukprot:7485266-Ditylum_brightwellii.AAC.1